LFLSIIRSLLKAGEPRLRFEEMLPGPEDYPQDSSGKRWAIEIQLDTLALRSPRLPLAAPAASAEIPEERLPHHGGVELYQRA